MQITNQIKNSVLMVIKLLAIGFIMLILLIPQNMISSLVRERAVRRDSVVAEVSYKWGNPQTLTGLILAIPYKKYSTIKKDGKEEKTEEINYAYFLPTNLNIRGSVEPETLKRGIYEVVVYKSLLDFKGEFKRPDFSKWDIKDEDVLWDKAIVSIGIPDTRGINENIKIAWNGKEFFTAPGTKMGLVLDPMARVNYSFAEDEFGIMPSATAQNAGADISGVSAEIPLEKEKEIYEYSFKINLNGSGSLNFSPLGSQTNVELASLWQNPSFDGAFLPDERNVAKDGFNAKWKILELNRNFPQSWLGKLSANISEFDFGVKLLIPVDEYQKTNRSIKYAILLIALTFLIFFFVEIINKIKIHPIQYILVGLAILLFFTLLLAITEYVNFNIAYLISSLATVLMIFLYSRTVLKKTRLAILATGILAAIYIFIFTIIQLQDYSLLVGSIGLFIILAVVMFVSRKIDWYGNGEKDGD